MVQVNGALRSCHLQTVRKILDAHRNGVFRVRNASGGSGVLGIIPAFGGLHGVVAPAAGFLHHNGLDQQNVIWDAVLLGIFTDDQLIGFHLRTEGQGFRGFVLASEDGGTVANENNNDDHQYGGSTTGHDCRIQGLCRFRRRFRQLCGGFCGFLCGNYGLAACGNSGMGIFLGGGHGGFFCFPECLRCCGISSFDGGTFGRFDGYGPLPCADGNAGFLLNGNFKRPS